MAHADPAVDLPAAMQMAEALSDLHASGDYGLALAHVYTKRAQLRALTRAQGGTL